jgi:hypothetical protein
MASNSSIFLKFGCIAPKIDCKNLSISEIGKQILEGKTCDCSFVKFNDTRRHTWQCKNRTKPVTSIVLDENIANSTSKSNASHVEKAIVPEAVDLADLYALPDGLKMSLQMAVEKLNVTLEQEIIFPDNLTGTIDPCDPKPKNDSAAAAKSGGADVKDTETGGSGSPSSPECKAANDTNANNTNASKWHENGTLVELDEIIKVCEENLKMQAQLAAASSDANSTDENAVNSTSSGSEETDAGTDAAEEGVVQSDSGGGFLERGEVRVRNTRQKVRELQFDESIPDDILGAYAHAVLRAARTTALDNSGVGPTLKAQKIIKIVEHDDHLSSNGNRVESSKAGPVPPPQAMLHTGSPIPRFSRRQAASNSSSTSIISSSPKSKTVTLGRKSQTDTAEQVQALYALRQRQGLGTAVPSLCHLQANPMDGLSNETATTMRYSKVSTTPECNCTQFLNSVRKHGMPVNGHLPRVCKAAMAHFAWRKGCEELLQLHAHTCLAAYSKEEYHRTSKIKKGKEESLYQKLMHKRTRQMYRLPSIRAQCDGMWQIVQMRCTEETGEASDLLEKYNWEHEVPVQPTTWFPRSPLAQHPPRRRRSFDEQLRFREGHEHIPASLGGSFSVLGSNFHRFLRLDAEMRRLGLLQRSPFYSTGADLGVDDLGNQGAGNSNMEPLWILPTSKPNPSKPRRAPKPPGRVTEKFNGLYLAWIRPDKICIPGKPPQPRRAMTLVGPLADKVTYVAYGGVGLTGRPNGGNADMPDDQYTGYADKSIAGNLRLDEHIFADTFILVDISKSTRKVKRGFGIGEHQCFSGEEPTPARAPDVKPNNFRNP